MFEKNSKSPNPQFLRKLQSSSKIHKVRLMFDAWCFSEALGLDIRVCPPASHPCP